MDLEQKAIERIRTASEMSLNYYKKPLVCTYSGGKDSDVMLELFRRSGVPFEVHHSHTTVDAPQTVYPYERAYKRAFNKMLDAMKADGTGRTPKWKNGEEVFLWWMEDKNIHGQMTLDDFI